MYEDISIFPTDFGANGQYGRDFYSPEIGFGRIEIEGHYEPVAQVLFLDRDDISNQEIEAESHVDLVDAITEDDIVLGVIRSTIEIGTNGLNGGS